MVKCLHCSEITAISARAHKGADDRRLRLSPIPREGPILEGKDWDGSDFLRDSFITKRALDWLLSVHAAPFVARPARVCIDGMTDKQKKWLEAATKPLGRS